MAQTRRAFLQTAAMAIGAAGTGAADAGDSPRVAGERTNRGLSPGPSPAQVPTMRFGGAEISRLIVGCNPFYGFSHFNNTLSQVMKEYYSAERVCDVLHQCARFGINAYNYVDLGRAGQDLDRFEAEGGRMHLIVQGIGDPAAFYKARKPLAMYHHGGRTDRAWMDGKIDTVREWCKQVRDLGCLVGVGSHKPEVLAHVESQGWDVDFYAGCVYNITRTEDEWRKALGGELIEMPSEIYLQSDPPRMYRFMQQTRKPCFAYKIMAAGRVSERAAEAAFTTAYASIKPTDAVFVGMFPRVKDEVRENAERVCRILTKS
jgi:hypothetical protein